MIKKRYWNAEKIQFQKIFNLNADSTRNLTVQTDRQTDTHTQTHRQIKRQSDGQTERKTDTCR